ncbi:MAG: Gfo/Idh/MocA family oxidoreductase [Chloroflexi bacterium]|nr:Gfo/Idh/MocA family oxidoreductase [Chloroflexota bacterium]
MPEDKLRLAIIGTGGIARRHITAIQDLFTRGLDDFVVTAACDVDEENLQRLAQQCEETLGRRPALYRDYQALLRDGVCDAVDLCLPHGLHHGVAVDCMDAGLHVLCEKPLGITIRACKVMAEKAAKTGLILSTAVPYRRLRGHRLARWVLNDAGLIGRPMSFFHAYTRPPRRLDPREPVPPALAWRQDRLMSGGGMVMDSGFHYCDGMRDLLGEVVQVSAEVREVISGEPLPLSQAREDTVFAILTFENGAVGAWQWSLSAPGAPLRQVVFYGTQGSLIDTTDSAFTVFHLFFSSGEVQLEDGSVRTWAELEGEYRRAIGEERWEFYYPRGLDDGFGFEIWEFVEAIQGRRQGVEVDGWEGTRSLAVCQAIYESALVGEPVRVADVLSGARRTYQAPIDAHWNL